jgi:hypothetical protein
MLAISMLQAILPQAISPALVQAMPSVLGQATFPASSVLPGVLAYRAFIDPLPMWDTWYLLLLPLCLGVSIVYKSTKCGRMSRVPWEATVIFTWILLGMVGAGAALVGIVKLF